MNQDLGLSQTAFGLGAGIISLRISCSSAVQPAAGPFGARKWIARIMLMRRRSDLVVERRFHVAFATFIAAA